MQAIILAAGMGKRLKALTKDNTKCMVKVNGVALIDRMLAQLDELDLERIVIVVGYEGRKLIDYIGTLDVSTPIEYIDNPIYNRTNNIYSLYLAREELKEDDTLLLESDLIFERGMLRDLVDDPRPTLALVDKYESWMDGTVVKLDGEDRISAFIPGKRFEFEDIAEYYKTVNIYKFSRDFSRTHYVPFLEAYSMALGNNEYYEQVLRVITMLDDSEVRAHRLDGQLWYEIDDLQDLDIAESMFAPTDAEKLELVQGRYGGYWRYPGMLDYCYLVNPHYPPQRLVDEMKASFGKLLTQYPSGMRVNSLLAAKTFGVAQEHVVVGNGAAELIKSLMEGFSGRVGFVRPTFEEYPNRYDPALSEVFVPDNDDFVYTADDLMAFFGGRGLEALVLINPDNPSGNYIPKMDVERLMAWAEDEGLRLVYDESFSDFADEEDNTFVDDALLTGYPHAIVMKSISKSFGVPGVRLGIMLSADEELIARTKKDVGIWNINSFGEFYLQIAEKYKGDYAQALGKLRGCRAGLASALAAVEGVRVIPSQANYLMLELTGGASATEVTERLLCGEGILVKDLTPKIRRDGRQYLRVAVRDEADNARLVDALRRVLG
ncbi:MAG: aminotransferase class I/II-fold pyridoxal phosphate-dependent enzyme [Actinomycetota bacterium]|nr:aminotransferase class I/II-fold pyridoxal phosphate-dependent enzyme [Actinomycetota bacterium]